MTPIMFAIRGRPGRPLLLPPVRRSSSDGACFRRQNSVRRSTKESEAAEAGRRADKPLLPGKTEYRAK